MLSEQYESHSKFIDVFMESLESETLTEDQKHKYEKAVDGAIKYVNNFIWLRYSPSLTATEAALYIKFGKIILFFTAFF